MALTLFLISGAVSEEARRETAQRTLSSAYALAAAIEEGRQWAARWDDVASWRRYGSVMRRALSGSVFPLALVSMISTLGMIIVILFGRSGQPGGATGFLVTPAFRVAFDDFGASLVAAYSALICVMVLIQGGRWFYVARSRQDRR